MSKYNPEININNFMPIVNDFDIGRFIKRRRVFDQCEKIMQVDSNIANKKEVLDNKRWALHIIKMYPWALEYVSERLKDDVDVALTARKLSKDTLKHASHRIQKIFNGGI